MNSSTRPSTAYRTIAPPVWRGALFLCAVLLLQKRRDTIDEGLGLLDLGMVSRLGNEFEACAGDQGAIGPSVGRLHDPVAGAPEHEGRDRDAAQPALQLRIVHVGMPA